jgi:hypothetical protein
MTNIKYLGDTDQNKKGEFGYLTTNGDSCHLRTDNHLYTHKMRLIK